MAILVEDKALCIPRIRAEIFDGEFTISVDQKRFGDFEESMRRHQVKK
jgi:hypothetical protein